MFIWWYPCLILQKKKDYRVLLLSTPLSSRWSVVWYPWFCACKLCLKLLNTSDLLKRKPLVMAALPAGLSAHSLPLTPACPRQYIHRVLKDGCWTLPLAINTLHTLEGLRINPSVTVEAVQQPKLPTVQRSNKRFNLFLPSHYYFNTCTMKEISIMLVKVMSAKKEVTLLGAGRPRLCL